MGRPREITKAKEGQTNISFRLPIQDFREFQELCIEENVDMSDKLRELVKAENQKKNTVAASPIGIAYGDGGRQTNLYEFSDSTDLEELNKAATYNHQFKRLKSITCNERLEKIAVLGLKQAEVAQDIIYFNKNGSYRSRGGGEIGHRAYWSQD
jgi:hypothetical protein